LASPLRPDERVEAIDAVRGAALYGVLVVNLMDAFRVPLLGAIVLTQTYEGIDQWASLFVRHVLQGKAVALFAFLFGLGMAVQYERRIAAGEGVGRLARRMLVLGVFGVLHLLFVWNGDILSQYAFCGLLLLPLLSADEGKLARWFWGLLFLHFTVPMVAVVTWPDTETLRRLYEQADRIYSMGSWGEVRIHSYVEFLVLLPMFASTLPETLCLFVAGMIAWRRGYFQRPGEHLPFLRRAAVAGIAIGAVMTMLGSDSRWVRDDAIGAALLQLFTASASPLILAMGYAAALLLYLHAHPAGAVARFLAPAGRMAFTNYIVQSLAFSWIFFGHGLGFINRLGPAAALAFGTAFFALQALASRGWLARHRYGPLEWLWRTLTYGRPP
jgi:uncharacterized protein